MLKVKYEMIPFGDKKKKYTLLDMEIINNATGTSFEGNYDINIKEKYKKKTKIQLNYFDRINNDAIVLLRDALTAYIDSREDNSYSDINRIVQEIYLKDFHDKQNKN